MKKLLSVAGFVALFVAVFLVGQKTAPVPQTKKFGGFATDAGFALTRQYSLACSGGAGSSTLLESTSTGRTSFLAADASSSDSIFLCRNATCTQAMGIRLTSSSPNFQQYDDYIGAYSCSSNATGSVTVTTSP